MIRSNILILAHEDISDAIQDFADKTDISKNNTSTVTYWSRLSDQQYMDNVFETFNEEIDKEVPLVIFSDIKSSLPYRAALILMADHKEMEIHHITNFTIGIVSYIITLSKCKTLWKKENIESHIKSIFEESIPEVISNVPSNKS